MGYNREVDLLCLHTCGVHGQLFVCPVLDIVLGVQGGDVAVDGGHEGGCFVLWEGLVSVWVCQVSFVLLDIVLVEDHHLVALVGFPNDK